MNKPIDWAMQEALEEVDALTPETPPAAPPRQQARPTKASPYSLLGTFVDGAYVERVDPLMHGLFLSDGRRVEVEWVQAHMTSPARV